MRGTAVRRRLSSAYNLPTQVGFLFIIGLLFFRSDVALSMKWVSQWRAHPPLNPEVRMSCSWSIAFCLVRSENWDVRWST